MRQNRIYLAATVFCLICIGVVMIYSSSCVYALSELKDSAYFLKRHLIFLTIGFIFTLAVMAVDYRILQKYAKPLLLFSVLLLIFVLIPGIGKKSSGAQRWFKLGMISFQPSELVKLAVIIYTADFLSRKQKLITDLKQGFIPLMLMMGLVCLLVVKQPDLGTTVEIAVVVLAMMFVAGARMAHLSLIALAAVPVIIYLVTSASYRMARIMAFLDPWQDAQGIGFQLTQSQIAIGSGGWFGVGLGKSQQKLFYLPAAHTDFIYSIIGEEFGLRGTLFIIILFLLLLWHGTRIAIRTVDSFGYYICVGILVMFGMQAAVNIGVSMGALPTKGLPLPFISYGGSALIFHMAAIGLLLNISRIQDL
jgi:cell division protein FtsW